MKHKTTRKAIVEGTPANRLLSIGYCGAADLLRNHQSVAYTCGVYGWNFDVYEVYGWTICTGYRNMPGRTAKNVHEYNAKARALIDEEINKHNHNWKELANKIEELLKEFLDSQDKQKSNFIAVF